MVWMRRHLTDSVHESVQQLWGDQHISRNSVSKRERAVGQNGSTRACCFKTAPCAAGLQVTREFISVTTRLLEGVWQPGEEAQPPDHTTSLLQHKLLSLRCCYAPGDLLGTRSSSLINLIISPYFSKLGFLGRLVISPANFPTEDHFNCSFAAKNAI